MADNWNCDGSGPHSRDAVRVLPTGGDSNLILCRACYRGEMSYRRVRNLELADDCKFDLPEWDSLKVYGEFTDDEAHHAITGE